MKYTIELTANARADLASWLKSDKSVVKRIHSLFANMQESPYTGLGHPEPLRYELSGCYSRRIDKKNRIVYSVDDCTRTIYVRQLRYHY